MKYRVRNWSEYNKNLVSRGDIRLFLPEQVVASWQPARERGSSRRGRPTKFSDSAILCALKIKVVFGLSYRALQGFLESLFERAGLLLPVPSYTQIAKRVQRLNLEVFGARRKYSEILVDSTGLKIVGQGEWLRKKHRNPDISDRRKMHVAVCAESLEVTAVVTTDAHAADYSALPELLHSTGRRIGTVYGDGAYDTQGSYSAITKLGARAIIPPRLNAKASRRDDRSSRARDDSVLQMIGLGGGDAGKALWKKLTGYHVRSLVENTVFRFKQMFGGGLWSRNRRAQETEVKAKILVLNDMTRQGMPLSEAVA